MPTSVLREPGTDADAAPRRDRTARQRSAAARAVGIGQPSASQHLRLLEAAAGQRLVERGGRGSGLTEAGEVLAARAAQALASLASAEEDWRRSPASEGTSTSAPLPSRASTCCPRRSSSGRIPRRDRRGEDQLDRRRPQTAGSGGRAARARGGDDGQARRSPALPGRRARAIAHPGLLPLVAGVVAAEASESISSSAGSRGGVQALVDDSLARAGAARPVAGSSGRARRSSAPHGKGGHRAPLPLRGCRGDRARRARALRDRRDPPDQAVALHRDGRRTRPSPAEQGFVSTLVQCCARTAGPA